jgi:hypothetical protein
MNTKIITGFLLGSLLASTHLDAQTQVCKEPKEISQCTDNQTPQAVNGCVKLEAVSKKNKRCTGPEGKQQCIERALEVPALATFYQRLKVSDSTVAGDSDKYDEIYCGTKERKPPFTYLVKCADAIPGSDCDSKGTGTGN